MSRNGQLVAPILPIADPGRRTLVAVALDYRDGEEIAPHRHAEAQLIYAVSGVMTVGTPIGQWVVPSQRAVWVPAGEAHAIRMRGAVGMRTVYVRSDASTAMPARCTVVVVGALLRAIILRLLELRDDHGDAPRARRLVAVFFDELRAAHQAPLHLPLPSDIRLRRITDALRAHPGDARTLAQWSRVAGGSPRTLARRFVHETGLSFGQWRHQARLLAALELLGRGTPVTTTALELGYETTSAFIAAFRRALGTTPGRYFA